MPVAWSSKEAKECWDGVREDIRREMERWEALTPEAKAKEQKRTNAKWAEFHKHKAFLDYCVAKKIDPNLVLPIKAKD